MNRRRVVIIIAVFVLIVVGIGIAYYVTHRENPKDAYLKSAVKITTDKDTGEQIIDDPNLTPQTEDRRAVIVLGIENLLDIGVLKVQTDFIKDSINSFSDKHLSNKYETITIRPDGLLMADGVITTTIRLGQTDEMLPIIITAKNTGETRVVIQDPSNKYGGAYDSGVTTFSAD